MIRKNYKVKDHCHYTGKYRGAAHNIGNLRYKITKEIPVVFLKFQYYFNSISIVFHFHSIIKELVKEFEGNFEYLGENTEKLHFQHQYRKKLKIKILK